MIQIVNTSTSNVQLGDVTVSTTPATPGILIPDDGQIAAGTTENIGAGAYSVKVYNTDLYPISVNGQSIEPNDHFELEAKYNPVDNRYDFCPAITVITPAEPEGSTAYYLAYRPSS